MEPKLQICYNSKQTLQCYLVTNKVDSFYFLSQHCLIPSESAKTYDSPCCQKYLCVTSGRSNKTRASLSRRQKCSKKVIYLHPYTAGKPNISDSCFCVYCTRTAIVFSRKEASMSFFFGIFYVNCNKTRTGNTAYRQLNNPYYL